MLLKQDFKPERTGGLIHSEYLFRQEDDVMKGRKEINNHLIWIIGLTLTLAFGSGLLACGGSSSNGSIRIGGDIVSVSGMQASCLSETFDYIECPSTVNVKFETYDLPDSSGPFSISGDIDGSPSVEIKNGKVNINLGAPKPGALNTASSLFPPPITVSDGAAKVFWLDVFWKKTNYIDIVWGSPLLGQDTFLSYALDPISTPDRLMYLYVDRPLTVIGSDPPSEYNIDAQPGWNAIIVSYEGGSHTTYYETGTPGNDYKWFFVPTGL